MARFDGKALSQSVMAAAVGTLVVSAILMVTARPCGVRLIVSALVVATGLALAVTFGGPLVVATRVAMAVATRMALMGLAVG